MEETDVDVSGVNSHMNNLRKYSRQLEERKREEIDSAAEAVAELVDDLAASWAGAGLPDSQNARPRSRRTNNSDSRTKRRPT